MNEREEVRSNIESLKEVRSLYEISLDIGISESTLYNFLTYDKVSTKMFSRIKSYVYNQG